MTSQSDTAQPPALIWTLTEGRAMFEYGMFSLLRTRMKALPKGDGHPVLTLPGFMASDRSTKPMRNLLDDLGYETFGWGLGQNVRLSHRRELEMLDLVDRIYDQTGRKLSMVGWSLGGVFARELAKMRPDKVRMVISMGSPIANNRRFSSARNLYESINGESEKTIPNERFEQLHRAPPMPTTSIMTKTDGIVAWKGSIQYPCAHPQTENIIVPASHIGLGVNPVVMVALADRLAQPEGEWTPFDRSGWREFVFDSPEFADAVAA
ncbi:MAG: alpha/beta fold hydrolase [Pseudomonadota bacterium]